MSVTMPLSINGWTLYAHPLFIDEIEKLITEVKVYQSKDPDNYTKKNATKRLYAITKLIFEIIPKDPTLPEYRQGNTLGSDHKHWFRAKFFQQYRLFFRFHSDAKIIVFAWVNNEKSKRAYDSKTDAYRFFEKMLNNGNPPDSWNELLKEAKGALSRLEKLARQLSD